MGEVRLRLLPLVVATALAACKADTPPLADGDGDIDEECTPYADQLIVYTPADGGSPSLGELAVGAPDDQAVTVATDDVLTVAFVGLGGIMEELVEAPDIRVHALATDGTEVNANLSIDGEVWETAGSIGNFDPEVGLDLDIDIAETASLSAVVYVQLVGVSGQLAVDSVESLQTTCSTSVR